jgi:hypothetical protein
MVKSTNGAYVCAIFSGLLTSFGAEYSENIQGVLKMVTACLSETSLSTNKSTRRHKSEAQSRRRHVQENVRCHKFVLSDVRGCENVEDRVLRKYLGLRGRKN